MFPGFHKIVEERIQAALKKGEFNNLDGAGKPLKLNNDANVPEELRLAYKILKNADMLPPEIELQKEIRQMEDLLENITDAAEKYRTIKKLNFLILKLNTIRGGPIELEIPQHYADRIYQRLESHRPKKSRR